LARSLEQGNDGCPDVEQEEEEEEAPVSGPQVLVVGAGVGLRGHDWVARHRAAMVARADFHARGQTDRGLRRQPAEMTQEYRHFYGKPLNNPEIERAFMQAGQRYRSPSPTGRRR
jgi:hypothetical protein